MIVRTMEAIIFDVMLIVRIMEADYIGYNADC